MSLLVCPMVKTAFADLVLPAYELARVQVRKAQNSMPSFISYHVCSTNLMIDKNQLFQVRFK